MTVAPAIEFAGVSRRVGGRAILDDISLSITRGQFVALIGPSGAGKTTLLKLANRLVEPDTGIVRIEGQDVATQPVAELRRGIGYVIQGIGLFPHMTVAENIGIVPRLSDVPMTTDRIDELLSLVALPAEMVSRYPRSLSGGQAQRVGVARALAGSPAIMLMDEPFGALDPGTRDELGRAYRALHDRLSLTTVMVTHDVGEALLLADRVVALVDGRVAADATPEALLSASLDPAVRALVEVPLRQAGKLAALRGGA